MELIAWLTYVLLSIGPYILIILIIGALLLLVVKLSFLGNKLLGYSTLTIVALGSGFILFNYQVSIPSTFKSACSSGTGITVFQNVKASSYTLMYPSHIGYVKGTDATFEKAILNIARKKIKYVELQDSFAGSFKHGHISSKLERFRKSEDRTGFYKVFLTSRGSAQCNWLMPIDLGLTENLNDNSYNKYREYLRYGSKESSLLQIPASDKKCIGVQYISAPTSTYSVELFLKQKVDKHLYKHEIRVVNAKTKTIVGNRVAYEFVADNVFTALAFRVGTNNSHPRCPRHDDGSPLLKILNI